MAAMTCTKCGLPGQAQDTFCRGCGTQVVPSPLAVGYHQDQTDGSYPNQPGLQGAASYNPNQPPEQYPNYPSDYADQSGGYHRGGPESYPPPPPAGSDFPIVAPYAAVPQTPEGSHSGDPRRWIWRQDKTLVFHKLAELPDRCIKCNEPAHGTRLKKRLSWHHPTIALLLLVGVLFYVVVAAVVRKRATVTLGFCTRHLKRRRAWVASGWLLLASSLAVLYLALIMQSAWTALGALGLLIASAVAGTVAGTFIGLKKIDKQYVWLKNVNEAYLARFPPFG